MLSPDILGSLLNNADAFEAALVAAFAPSPMPDPVEWIEGNFRLSEGDSASPGLVVLEPWQKEVIAAWSERSTREVVVSASSQTGKTLIGLALAAYCARYRIGPALYVVETDEAADTFARRRVQLMAGCNLEDIRPTSPRARGTTVELNFVNGSGLSVVGANAPGNLSSRPVKNLFATEVRGFPVSARKDGDPLSMALARLKAFPSAKAFIESSPGILGSCRLTQEFEKGDCRRWHVPCPHCDGLHPVAYDPKPGYHHIYFNRAEDAAICCHDCGTLWSAAERLDAIRAGRFVATAEASEPGIVSFHYSELVSTRSDLVDVVRRVEAAKTVEQRQTAKNTILGEPFDLTQDGGEQIADERFDAIRIRFNARQLLPEEVAYATAGIDMQHDRAEIQVVGHALGNRRYVLEYKVIEGDPFGTALYEQIEDYLRSAIFPHPYGGKVRISATCIDSGFATASVYAAVERMWKRGLHIWAIKGVPGQGKPLARRSHYTAAWQGGEKIINIGSDTGKRIVFEALKNEGEENRIFIPDSFDKSYFDGITSESMIVTTDKKGSPVIGFRKIKHDARNESLDTLSYSIAAFAVVHPAPDLAACLRGLKVSTSTTDNEAPKLSNLRRAMGLQ